MAGERPGDPVLDSLAGYTLHVPGHGNLLQTTIAGDFHFDLMAPGSYHLQADKPGRAPVALGGITVVVAGKTTHVATVVVPCSVQCGDAVIGLNEQCDDGNANSGDGCSSTCQTENQCGNEVIDHGEVCDGADLGGETCGALGFGPGTLTCSNCQLSVEGCGIDDGNPCIQDAFSYGVVIHPNEPAGTNVGSCLICNGEGNTVADPACAPG